MHRHSILCLAMEKVVQYVVLTNNGDAHSHNHNASATYNLHITLQLPLISLSASNTKEQETYGTSKLMLFM